MYQNATHANDRRLARAQQGVSRLSPLPCQAWSTANRPSTAIGIGCGKLRRTQPGRPGDGDGTGRESVAAKT